MRLNHVCVIPGRGCACGVVGMHVAGTVMPVHIQRVLAEVAWDGAP